MIITIDGPAGSGKSTIAELISKKLNITHFNSGLLYRGIAAHLKSLNFNILSMTENSQVPNFTLKTNFINNVQHVYVNDIDYTSQLRQNEISTLTPYVSKNRTIRERIDNCQRSFGANNNIVIEGRDTGSFVFPYAEYKFYLDCNIAERARRRYNEEKEKNSNISLKDIENQLIERDKIDKTKKIAPLVIPKNAIIVDSSNLSIEQVLNTILSKININ